MSSIKNTVKSLLVKILFFINRTRFGSRIFEDILKEAMSFTIKVKHEDVELRIVAPNALNKFRAETFSTKEPETLDWIDGFSKDSVMWDIGANIGLYSCYAVKKKSSMVYAFEPSVFNLELLSRNIYSNGLTDKICIIPIPLGEKLMNSHFKLTTTEWGGALSTFSENFGWDGNDIKGVFDYQILGISMDDAVNALGIPLPDYLKIDVDGLEHFILKGGKHVLENVKEVLIEINDDFYEQEESCKKILLTAGLKLTAKLHSEYIENNTNGFQNSYNQIWKR